MSLLSVEDLAIEFLVEGAALRVVDDLSFTVNPGEMVCLVGESGSGKTVTALSIGRLMSEKLVRFPKGAIRLDGIDLLKLPEKEMQSIRGKKVSYIFQEPSVHLHPVFSVGSQILETLRLHQPKVANRSTVVTLLGDVGISD